MYTSVLKIKGKEFKGTLDIYVLKMVQEDLSEIGIKTTIPNIFIKISELDMHYISSLILNSISRLNEESANEFLELYLSVTEDKERIEIFNSMYSYINNLFEKCLPKLKNNTEKSIFEDDYLLYEDEEWELDFMEYLWSTVIKRNENLLNITPRNFFEQVNVYKRFNNIKDEKVEMF